MVWVLLALVLLGGLALASLYNRLIGLQVAAASAWSDIDVQLKRRHDLIPNLVETVKGYAAHERDTLERVVTARNAAVAAHGPAAREGAERELAGALRQLFALAESYPELRAVESFSGLQGSLEEIEAHLQNARRYYNAVVRDFNTLLAQFPANVVAGWFRFRPREFFELEAEGERAVPRVGFGA